MRAKAATTDEQYRLIMECRASATVYTMVEMARAHGLNIYKYLKYLLERLPGTKMTDSALSKLSPWNQEVIASCSGAM